MTPHGTRMVMLVDDGIATGGTIQAAVEAVRGERHGDCIRAFVGGAGGNSGNARENIVLMGHRDTVFPAGEPTRRPFTIRDGRAYGPGVADLIIRYCWLSTRA